MANITFIGNNSAGVTTYVGALACYSKYAKDKNNKNVVKIQPINDDAIKIQQGFEDIILQNKFYGISFSRTYLKPIFEIPSYSFQLKTHKVSKYIDFVIKDYAGGWFESLTNGINIHLNSIDLEYLEELVRSDQTGILILLDRLTKDGDIFYSKIIKNLLDLLPSFLGKRTMRIAVVINKCERGEIWTRRQNPEDDIFRLYLPKTRKVLRDSFLSEYCQFFATSVFGVLDGHRDPRPNRIKENGVCSILREPQAWQPYNIVSPIYWLCTGKKLKNYNYIYY